ncbi:MAG: replicative DNA helicase [Candidatus Shikimatogenerans bostrichidophilus]|nr:MAG: replicative DNA helicase [Candidatus Shikimatogenerans bostrichidophilus]
MNFKKKIPNAIELEEIVLGSIIVNKKNLEKIINLLDEKIFFKKSNIIIYKYIYKIYNECKKVDLFTLINFLKRDEKLEEIGGEYYLSYLIQKISSIFNLKKYINILIKKYILRELIRISLKIIKNSYKNNANVLDILDYIQLKILNLTKKYVKTTSIKNIKKLISKTLKKLEKNFLNKKLLYIPTGFKLLDNIILGLQKSDLIIIASRPGMGKTSFSLSLAFNILKKKIPVGFFSLEMSYFQIMTRLISFFVKIPYDKLKMFDFKKKEFKIFKKKIKKIKKYPFLLDDSSSLSILEFKQKCKKLIYEHNVKIIIVDYLQLINVKKSNIRISNREQEIAAISRNMKYIAKEFKITIIAISQLSRAVELRGGYKKPLLSDLRESGSIEQDADIVLFLYRPEYYGFKYWDNDKKNICTGEAEIIIAKHRNGKLGNIRLKFINETAMFEDI